MLNLEWCTNKENVEHAVANNLVCFGEAAPGSKLTINDIKEMRWLHELGYSVYSIAKDWRIESKYCWRIVNRKIWRRVA